MSELKKCCENCGNIRCASSVVAYWWDECVMRFRLRDKRTGEVYEHGEL